MFLSFKERQFMVKEKHKQFFCNNCVVVFCGLLFPFIGFYVVGLLFFCFVFCFLTILVLFCLLFFLIIFHVR